MERINAASNAAFVLAVLLLIILNLAVGSLDKQDQHLNKN